MTQGNSTTIHIDFGGINLKFCNKTQNHGCKGFIDFKQINIFNP